jgi:hypothetical protein
MVTQLYALATPGTKLFRTIASSKNSAVAAGVSCMRLKTPSCTAGTGDLLRIDINHHNSILPAGFLRDILEESARESRRFWMHRQTSSRGDTDDGLVSRRGLLQTATARSPWKEAGRICLLGPPSHLIQAHNWNRDWKKVRSRAGVTSGTIRQNVNYRG